MPDILDKKFPEIMGLHMQRSGPAASASKYCDKINMDVERQNKSIYVTPAKAGVQYYIDSS